MVYIYIFFIIFFCFVFICLFVEISSLPVQPRSFSILSASAACHCSVRLPAVKWAARRPTPTRACHQSGSLAQEELGDRKIWCATVWTFEQIWTVFLCLFEPFRDDYRPHPVNWTERKVGSWAEVGPNTSQLGPNLGISCAELAKWFNMCNLVLLARIGRKLGPKPHYVGPNLSPSLEPIGQAGLKLEPRGQLGPCWPKSTPCCGRVEPKQWIRMVLFWFAKCAN